MERRRLRAADRTQTGLLWSLFLWAVVTVGVVLACVGYEWEVYTPIDDPSITNPTDAYCLPGAEVGFTCSRCEDIDRYRQIGGQWQEDEDVVTYTWTKTGGSWKSGDEGSSVTWIAPQTTGSYTITVTVDDEAVKDPPGEGTRDDDSKQDSFEITVFSVDIKAADGVSAPPDYVLADDSVQLKGVPDPDTLSGAYSWSTMDDEVSLTNPASQTVTVNGEAPGQATVDLDFTPTGSSHTATDSHVLTVLDLDLVAGYVSDTEEADPGVYIAKDEEWWPSPLQFWFSDEVASLEAGTVTISVDAQVTLYDDWTLMDELTKLQYVLSVDTDRAEFLSDIYRKTYYVVGETASSSTKDAPVSCTLAIDDDSKLDSVCYTVIDVALSGGTIQMEVGDTTTVTCTSKPDVGSVPDEVGAWLYWTLIDSAGASGDFDPPYGTSESTVFTAETGGTAYLQVIYYVDGQGDWPYRSDSTLVTITGVGIFEPAVGVKDETTQLSASGYPVGDTYQWSIVQGPASGTFGSQNGTTSDTVDFTGTVAGTGIVQVVYGAADDTADLIVLDVSIGTSSLSMEKGDTAEITADAVPDPGDIGGLLYWYVDEGQAGGSFDPSFSTSSETTIFTATEAGTARVVVEYWYGGEHASDSIPLTVAGVTILDKPLVVVKSETEEFETSCYPEGGTFTWSLLDPAGADANGTFDNSNGGTQASSIVFTASAAGTDIVQVEYVVSGTSRTDTADLCVLAVELSASSLTMETGETTILTANATPDLADIGASLTWYIEWGSDPAGDATLSPSYSTSGETSLLTAIEPGMGVLTVEYSYRDKSGTDTADLTIVGVQIVNTEGWSFINVDDVGDTVLLTALGLPAGGTYSWSLLDENGAMADGTFDEYGETATFTATAAGTDVVQVSYELDGATDSDSAPLAIGFRVDPAAKIFVGPSDVHWESEVPACVGDPVEFRARSKIAAGAEYDWDWTSDGSVDASGTATNKEHVYWSNPNFDPRRTLTVTGALGGVADTGTVMVDLHEAVVFEDPDLRSDYGPTAAEFIHGLLLHEGYISRFREATRDFLGEEIRYNDVFVYSGHGDKDESPPEAYIWFRPNAAYTPLRIARARTGWPRSTSSARCYKHVHLSACRSGQDSCWPAAFGAADGGSVVGWIGKVNNAHAIAFDTWFWIKVLADGYSTGTATSVAHGLCAIDPRYPVWALAEGVWNGYPAYPTCYGSVYLHK